METTFQYLPFWGFTGVFFYPNIYMSISIPPPEFNFTGLFYNPEWWISTSVASGALTQSVANTLYLRKTTTGSASALETLFPMVPVDKTAILVPFFKVSIFPISILEKGCCQAIISPFPLGYLIAIG